jgi:hypothetical protein
MKAVVKKGRSRPIGDKFKLYVTGYARFFSTETRECDPVTFARDANPKDDGKEHPRMTKEVREDFNKMSDALNQAVQDAVGRNKETGVTFIDIQNVNGEDKLKGHRYCGPGVTEPDTGNTNLYFWHYPYNEADDSKEAPIIKLFTDKYNEVVGDLSVQDSVAKWPNELDLENAIYLAVKEGEIPDKADSGNMALPGWDSIGWRARVFHPQVRYHAFIRDRILAQYKADTSGGGSPGGFVCGADAKFTDSKVASWYQALGQFIPEEPEWTVYNMDCGRANNLIPQNDNGETCGTCNPCEGPNALFGCGEKNGQTIFQTMVAGGQQYVAH